MLKKQLFTNELRNVSLVRLIGLLIILANGLPAVAHQDARQAAEPQVELSGAVIVTPSSLSRSEEKAVMMLVEEVEKRTQLRMPRTSAFPTDATTTVIAVGQVSNIKAFTGRYAQRLTNASDVSGHEGYRIQVENDRPAPAVFVIGNDTRGTLFGVGHLLRSMQMKKGKLTMPGTLRVVTAPKYPVRGHQLGYRPKTNSYDGWTLPMWEQYIRDLVVFGTNAIELIPPRSDDAPDSPHFPLPQIEMMEGMSRIADEYGLDVWIWYPALDKDYSDPQTVELALYEWGEVFKRLPRINAVMVPGGDPGHTQPKYLISLLEKQTKVLRQYHPQAQMWLSPQGFDQQWMEEFYGILRNEQLDWLSGIVFGPQVRVSLPQLRAAVPKKYPIRRYPDITHSRSSQYPVPEWDVAYALTEAREVINPRPLDQAQIFRHYQDYAIGFITYSEGCNDDVNKIVWSSLGWDPNANVVDILRQYSRYFINDCCADDFAQGLLALERNWRGSLLTNENVYTTLRQFQAMEERASPQDLLNWRFQQALYRAYYDAYTRSRLIEETTLEERAMSILRDGKRHGSLIAISEAESALGQGVVAPIYQGWRARVFELAEALYQSVRMQLSVERYKAISVGRGANLDTIDLPLNNRLWLKRKFEELRKLPEEADRLKGVDEILNWTDPGPGGFYDDLGNLARQTHLVKGPGFETDPAFLQSALVGFAYRPDWHRTWWTHAESLNDYPLAMRYTDLDSTAEYKLRVVYAGDTTRVKIRLVAGENIEVHPYIKKEFPVKPVEFDIPKSAIRNGELNLNWTREPGLGGNGRGAQVAEVWLIKKR